MEQIVGVDVGGTFTDLILIDESSGGVSISKVPSTPENQAYGVMEALKAASVDLPALKILIHGTTVTTNALHPGVVDTNIMGNAPGPIRWLALKVVGPLFLLTPEQGAATSLHVATSPSLEGVSGRYFASSREARVSKAAKSDADARRLWEVSEQLADLTCSVG